MSYSSCQKDKHRVSGYNSFLCFMLLHHLFVGRIKRVKYLSLPVMNDFLFFSFPLHTHTHTHMFPCGITMWQIILCIFTIYHKMYLVIRHILKENIFLVTFISSRKVVAHGFNIKTSKNYPSKLFHFSYSTKCE